MLREVELAEPGGSGRTAGGSGAVDGEEVEVEDDDVRLLPAALEMPLGAGGQSSSFWSNLRASLREEPLLMQTLVGVIVGVCIGSIARACDPSPTTVELVAFPGELFMRVLRGLVIPLVSVSMVCGVLSLFDKTNGTNGGAKRVAFRLMLAYLVTTLVACAIGLLVVHAVRPGDGVSLQMGRDCGAKVERTVPSPATQRSGGALASVLTTARAAVPSNVFNALNEGNVLGIITASLFFGTAIASVDGNSTKDVVTLFHALDKIIQLCVKWATQLMPIGVSSIVAGRISGTCDPTQMLSALGKYVFCILLGLGAHAAVALPGYSFSRPRQNNPVVRQVGHAIDAHRRQFNRRGAHLWDVRPNADVIGAGEVRVLHFAGARRARRGCASRDVRRRYVHTVFEGVFFHKKPRRCKKCWKCFPTPSSAFLPAGHKSGRPILRHRVRGGQFIRGVTENHCVRHESGSPGKFGEVLPSPRRHCEHERNGALRRYVFCFPNPVDCLPIQD